MSGFDRVGMGGGSPLMVCEKGPRREAKSILAWQPTEKGVFMSPGWKASGRAWGVPIADRGVHVQWSAEQVSKGAV